MNLLDYKNNFRSQYGEDGIINKIFDIIGVSKNPFFVEFGAWDGEFLSNTFNLSENHNFGGLLIEGNKKRAKKLKEKFSNNSKIVCVEAFVDTNSNSLNKLLKKHAIPSEFDLLSIDIDGNDYEVWQSLTDYSPRLVIIEYNATFPPDYEFVDYGGKSYTGSSALSLTKLANKKGYELVCTTMSNLFFVKKETYPTFNISDNSVIKLQNKENLNFVALNFAGELVFEKNNFPNKFVIRYSRVKKKIKLLFKKSFYFIGEEYK